MTTPLGTGGSGTADGPAPLNVARQSAATAADRLTGLAAGAQPAALAALGEQLLAVADLLRHQPRLRRALTDPTRSAGDRVGLLRSLLTGKVSTEALDLLATLVDGRWSAHTELLDAAERLGVDALLHSAERAGDLADVEDQLFRFSRTVDGDVALAAALGDVTAGLDRRARLVHDLLDGPALPVTVRLVVFALSGLGGRGFAYSLARLVELAAARRERSVAYVTTATGLSADEQQRLAGALAGRYGREVSVKVTVDPSVIGGVRIRVGSDLYDGTVARRLAEARQAMTR